MKLLASLLLVAAMAAGSVPAPASKQAPGNPEPTVDAMLDFAIQVFGASSTARMARNIGQVEEAARTIDALMADPRFEAADEIVHASAYSGAAWAAARTGKRELAVDLVTRALALAPADDDDLLLLAKLQSDLGDSRAALATYGRFLDVRTLRSIPDEDWLLFLIQFSDRALPERDAVLERLQIDHWTPSERVRSYLAYQLALSRLRAGRTKGMAALLEQIVLPDLLVMLRVDKRFDPYVDRNAVTFDVARAARRRVESLRTGLPTPLAPTRESAELFRAMLVAGDHEGVLAQSAPLLEVPPADADPRVLAALRELRARALLRAGRTDEAVASQEAAAAPFADGKVNVNQTLDLAGFYCDLGRGEDTLRAVERVQGDMNPFGRLVRAYQAHCAHVLLGNQDAAMRELAFIETQRALRPSLHADALVRAGDLDRAAAAFIALLQDEDSRPDTLAAVQEYADTPNASKAAQHKSENWRALLERKDVQAAIDAVGRVEHYDVFL